MDHALLPSGSQCFRVFSRCHLQVMNGWGCAVPTGLWVGDCFIYNNAAWRLNYCVGGEVTVMYHLDRPMYLLGYLASQQRVYLIDKVRACSLPFFPLIRKDQVCRHEPQVLRTPVDRSMDYAGSNP